MADDPNQDRPTIQCKKNGPYLVHDLNQFTGVDDKAVETRPVMALCRCGRSDKRPFCDGTHVAAGFRDETSPDRVPDQLDSYETADVTIHDNRGLCSHAALCSEQLGQVFRAGTKPWIDPDGAPVEEIDRIVKLCPSGALSYTASGVKHQDMDRDPAIRIAPHGPYVVQGGIRVEDVNGLQGASLERCTLCRCGFSKNKPFCDGTHWYANYRDDDKVRVATLSELKDDGALEVDLEGVALLVSKDGDSARVVAKEGGRAFAVTVDPRWGEILIVRERL